MTKKLRIATVLPLLLLLVCSSFILFGCEDREDTKLTFSGGGTSSAPINCYVGDKAADILNGITFTYTPAEGEKDAKGADVQKEENKTYAQLKENGFYVMFDTSTASEKTRTAICYYKDGSCTIYYNVLAKA